MFLPISWFARRSLRQPTQGIASTLACHGLGWLVVQVGPGNLLPFQRGWLGHPVREAPYTQAEQPRMARADLGAAFIKLGQALSTRPDLFTPEHLTELAKLRDAVSPRPFEQIRHMVYDEPGEWPEDLITAFDPQPPAVLARAELAHAAGEAPGQSALEAAEPGTNLAQHVVRLLNRLGRGDLGLLMIVYHPTVWVRVGDWQFGQACLFALGFIAWWIWNIWRSGCR